MYTQTLQQANRVLGGKDMELWKEIVNFPGYEVSTYGRVRSYMNNRHGIGDSEKYLKFIENHNGYFTVCLGRGNRRLVSRLVAEAFIPNPNNYPIVRHMDDNPHNNNVKNLKWGTQEDNMQDCVRHGRLVGDTSSAILARSKKVLAVNMTTGEELIFNSYNEAARYLNIPNQSISKVTRKLYGMKQTHGWTFRELEEC